jgi:hypothetical protein
MRWQIDLGQEEAIDWAARSGGQADESVAQAGIIFSLEEALRELLPAALRPFASKR